MTIRFASVLSFSVLAGCATHATHSGAADAKPILMPGAGPYTPEQVAEIRAAIDRLGWLIGAWDGEGFVRSSDPGSERILARTHWDIAKRYDDRFLELSFTMEFFDGRRAHWAGYFTWDVDAHEYVTLWMGLGTAYMFHERGALSPEGDELALTSMQGGAGDEVVTVHSVFTSVGPNEFRVQDTTHAPNAEPVVTLSFEVRR